MYRIPCFQCNSTQVYSLQLMKCVDSCDPEELRIGSAYIHGLRVCRKLEYYINPSSESILELGTRVHPYKNINLALFDMFNFLTGDYKSAAIRLSQNDVHYMVSLVHDSTIDPQQGCHT